MLPENKAVNILQKQQRVSISVISPNSSISIANVQDYHESQAASSYLSPAFSKPLLQVWVPEYVKNLAGEKLDMFEHLDEKKENEDLNLKEEP